MSSTIGRPMAQWAVIVAVTAHNEMVNLSAPTAIGSRSYVPSLQPLQLANLLYRTDKHRLVSKNDQYHVHV